MCLNYETVFIYLCLVLNLMNEWSDFNGQGSENVLRIWQLLQVLLCRNLPGFTGIMKFQRTFLVAYPSVFSSNFRCFLHVPAVDLF